MKNRKLSERSQLTIEEVARRFDATPKGKGYVALCPAHDDHRPSLSIDPGDVQPIVIKCWSHNCDLNSILAAVGLEPKDICNGNGNGAGAGTYREAMSVMQRTHPHDKAPAEIPAFDWTEARENATNRRLAQIAVWRDFHQTTLIDLRDRDLIGVIDGQVAFPVFDDWGWIVGAHVRAKNGDGWYYTPKGVRTSPLVFSTDMREGGIWFVAESTWDAIACYQLSGEQTVICTRGAGNGRLVRGLIPVASTVFLLTQNDPLDKNGSSPALKWERDVLSNLDRDCKPYRVSIPAEYEDLNAWMASSIQPGLEWPVGGVTTKEFWEACFP
jgi:hypothetical protein